MSRDARTLKSPTGQASMTNTGSKSLHRQPGNQLCHLVPVMVNQRIPETVSAGTLSAGAWVRIYVRACPRPGDPNQENDRHRHKITQFAGRRSIRVTSPVLAIPAAETPGWLWEDSGAGCELCITMESKLAAQGGKFHGRVQGNSMSRNEPYISCDHIRLNCLSSSSRVKISSVGRP